MTNVPIVCDNLSMMLTKIHEETASVLHTSCDSKTGHEVICHSPDSGLQLEWCPICSNKSIDWKCDNESDIEPVDVLIPVGTGNRLLGDMWLLRVVLLVADRLRSACHTRWRLCCLRCHGCVMATVVNEWNVVKREEECLGWEAERYKASRGFRTCTSAS
jgi:hypothetical protein